MLKATDLTVALENRPGTLAKATEAIATSGANIDGFCGSTDGGTPSVHFLFIRDAEKARGALESAGFKVHRSREVALVDVDDKPGAAAKQFRKIAQQELNIDLAYLATNNRVAIGGGDPQKIWDALATEARVTA